MMESTDYSEKTYDNIILLFMTETCKLQYSPIYTDRSHFTPSVLLFFPFMITNLDIEPISPSLICFQSDEQ